MERESSKVWAKIVPITVPIGTRFNPSAVTPRDGLASFNKLSDEMIVLQKMTADQVKRKEELRRQQHQKKKDEKRKKKQKRKGR